MEIEYKYLNEEKNLEEYTKDFNSYIGTIEYGLKIAKLRFNKKEWNVVSNEMKHIILNIKDIIRLTEKLNKVF